MTEPRVLSITVELSDEQGGSTIVIRDPFGPARRVYTTGTAQLPEARQVIELLGLSAPLTDSSHPPSVRPPSVRPPSVRSPSSSPPPVSVIGATPLSFRVGPLSQRPAAPSLVPPETVEVREETAPLDLTPSALYREPLPATLEALVGSVLRAGRNAQTSTVDEAIAAAKNSLSERALPCIARLLGRLESALAPSAPVEETALVLAAIGCVARRLSSNPDDPTSLELDGSELEAEPMPWCELVEVGRRRERAGVGWETRLLVDLRSGELLREAGVPARGALSLGSPGRRLVVSFSSRLAGRDPARLRIYQYEYAPAAAPAELARAAGFAERSFALPDEVDDDPLLLVARPLPVLLAPERIESDRTTGVRLVDTEGRCLLLADDLEPGACEALLDFIESGAGRIVALAGALVARTGGIAFVPWSALTGNDEACRLLQLAL